MGKTKSRKSKEGKITMLPIQRSQFTAQCKTYKRLNDQLNKMLEFTAQQQAESYSHQQMALAAEMVQKYESKQCQVNEQIRTVQHVPSEQVEEDYVPSHNIETSQVNSMMSTSAPEIRMALVNNKGYNYFVKTLLDFDVMSVFELYTDIPQQLEPSSDTLLQLQPTTETVQQCVPVVNNKDDIVETSSPSISCLLERKANKLLNIENVMDELSDGSSPPSLIIDSDYESEKEKANGSHVSNNGVCNPQFGYVKDDLVGNQSRY